MTKIVDDMYRVKVISLTKKITFLLFALPAFANCMPLANKLAAQDPKRQIYYFTKIEQAANTLY